MFKIILLIVAFFTAISCSSNLKKTIPVEREIRVEVTPAAKLVLETSDSMIKKKEIVVGACWDFINTVYNRAGFSPDKRVTIFKGKHKGPYVNADRVLPGDWLYFVNHSYRDIEHSAIFVTWTDKEKKEALMVSYMGKQKKRPAFYKKYLLTNIYNIIRAREKN